MLFKETGDFHYSNFSSSSFFICLLDMAMLWSDYFKESHVVFGRLAKTPSYRVVFFFWLFLLLFRGAPAAYGISQARGQIRAAAAGIHHSHNNTGSELHLWPTPQLMAMPDPQPTEQGQGHVLMDPEDSLPLRHYGNSHFYFLLEDRPLIYTNRLW